MTHFPRLSLCLNGEWQFCPLADPAPLASLPANPAWEAEPVRVPSSWRWSSNPAAEFQPYDLFGYPARWNDAPAGLLRRTFTYSASGEGRTWLIFHGVLQRWQVFINGAAVGTAGAGAGTAGAGAGAAGAGAGAAEAGAVCDESFLPVELDVTDFLRPGENELALWCGPWERVATPTGEKALTPCGSWFAGLGRGPWQDVFLETRPAVWLDDLCVQTSVRQGKINVQVTLENRSGKDFRGRLEVSTAPASFQTAAEEHCPAWECAVAASAGERLTVCLEADWPDANLWSPASPHLYILDAKLEGGASLRDERTTRFGFREIWIEGPHFMLNGMRLNLRGDAWHYQGFVYQTVEYARNWYRASKEAGVNFIRLHAQPYPEFFLDAADEEGMLIIDESAIYGSGKAVLADDPRFIENCRAHLERLIRRDRSHPSVMVWSMQNEMRWVDGREGYRDAMPALTAAMRRLDATRPISYDGDNRLVPAEWCEINSMHYNIDGAVASWDKTKPLIFGEHGPYHYISPQVCTDLAGADAYLSYERCLQAIGESERLFIEYARREGAAVTPFNLVHYSHWTLPDADVPLTWERLDTPGPKPRRIPAHTLTINNGLVPGPRHIPNPAYAPVQRAFQPVAIFADELDTQFFAGACRRGFSLYNDTEQTAEVRLVWTLSQGGDPLESGEESFRQPPGERLGWEHTFQFQAEGPQARRCTLALQLFHRGQLRAACEVTYTIYPNSLRAQALDCGSQRLAYLGDPSAAARLQQWLPGLQVLAALDAAALESLDVLVIGAFYRGAQDIQTLLGDFVARGGALLVLEQDQFSLGELTLSGRKFFSAFPVQPPAPAHPVFESLTAEDLRFWTPDNPHAAEWRGMVRNAFHKPSRGDLEILLECGEGNFGWGGLLWTPLVAYRHGAGRVVCCQVALEEYCATVPQAARLLRNLLAFVLQKPSAAYADTVYYPLHATPTWLKGLGLKTILKLIPEPGDLLVVDPAHLSSGYLIAVSEFLRRGHTLLVLPAQPDDQQVLRELSRVPLTLTLDEAPVYQLAAAAPHPLLRGVSAFDLSLFEHVTYTPPSYTNRLIARYALDIPGATPLLCNVQAPWEEYFIHGCDSENIKMAVATLNRQAAFQPAVYAAELCVGKGRIIFCQVLTEVASPKVQRIYSRLLANLGAEVQTDLFSRQKQVVDASLESVMALPRLDYQDYAAMLAYFTDPAYTLNNLGEGVYGWMIRLEKRDGALHVPAQAAGQTWFLTAFVESGINRDPSLRASGELPDSSIVPDLFIEANCAVQVFLNGRAILNAQEPPTGVIKVEDAPLKQGINRLALVCRAASEEPRLNLWFLNKYGDPLSDLRTHLTLD